MFVFFCCLLCFIFCLFYFSNIFLSVFSFASFCLIISLYVLFILFVFVCFCLFPCLFTFLIIVFWGEGRVLVFVASFVYVFVTSLFCFVLLRLFF